jgi:hypothetical protein
MPGFTVDDEQETEAVTMKFYDIILRGAGQDRRVRVPSPTDAQAADAASPLMRDGETIVSIEQVPDDGLQPTDAPPPKSQADELAPVTPGAASTDRN